MNTKPIQCPNCKQSFAKIIKNKYGQFCPKCHIRLFKTTTKSHENINLNKETLKSITRSFLYAIVFTLMLALSKVIGIFDLYKQNQTAIMIIFIVVIGLLAFWDRHKQGQKTSYFSHGVDTLDDYHKDNCDYKIIKQNLKIHQCPNCQSYRMTDLFFFKRRCDIKFNTQDINDDKFVGCLKCGSAFTIAISTKNKANQFLWLILIGFICMLIALYFIIASFDILYRGLTSYFLVVWGFIFAQFQVRLHENNPVNVNYTQI